MRGNKSIRGPPMRCPRSLPAFVREVRQAHLSDSRKGAKRGQQGTSLRRLLPRSRPSRLSRQARQQSPGRRRTSRAERHGTPGGPGRPDSHLRGGLGCTGLLHRRLAAGRGAGRQGLPAPARRLQRRRAARPATLREGRTRQRLGVSSSPPGRSSERPVTLSQCRYPQTPCGQAGT